ncbi:MAG: TonB-dependent receptor plug domain-containing protein [Luteitalea sp.]|nr:TonB-dependent receptor plug domain-containing protein [Luteitalea sp.]
MRAIVSVVIVLTCAVAVPPYAPAQTVTGGVHGTVTDTTQASIPGVSVTASEAETGLVRHAVTGEQGYYRFDALPPGTYVIVAELSGFRRYEQRGVEVSVGQTVRVDATLDVGELSDSVTVEGRGSVVDTRTAEISGLVDDKRMTDLPLSGRNVIEFAKLLPGVSTVHAPQIQEDTRGGPRLTVHGGRANQNFFTLNGTYFNNPSRNTGLNPPPPDAVREFRIKTNNFGAADGRNAGATVSVVSRRGTNEFHGSIWEFHRNDGLNARSFFDTTKPERTQNQFGFAAGGPIVPGKVFLFGAYEGFRDRPEPSSTDAFPPTAAERAGNFSDRTAQLVNPFTGDPLPNNRIDPALFDPVSVARLETLPLPNTPDGRLVTNNPNPNDNNLVLLRNDVQVNERQSVFWHLYWNRNERPTRLAGNIPEWGAYASDADIWNVGVNHLYTIKPNLLAETTVGFTRTTQANDPLVDRGFDAIGMDFPNYHPQGSPQFSVSGHFSLSSDNGFTNRSDAYSIAEKLTWIKGSHTLKFGGELYRLTFFQGWLSPPSFTFNGARSGDPMLDFMMGAWREANVSFGLRQNDTVQPWHWSFYFQDEWRAHPRLTLTLGMRYELPSPWNDKRELALSTVAFPIADHQTSAPIPNVPPGYLFANYDLPAGLVEADKNNFAPRLGLAWDVFGDGTTSLRAGGGVFYDTGNADTLAQVNPPFSSTRTLVNGRLGAPNAGASGPLPPSDVQPDPSQGIFSRPVTGLFTDLELRTPYFYHWNVGIQRQLTEDLGISIDYIGKIGKKQQAFVPWNPAIFIPGTDEDGNPLSTLENVDERALHSPGIYGTSGNLMLRSMFDSWYHGLEVQVNRRLRDGLSILGSYTFSKAIDQNSTFTLGGDTPNPFLLAESEQGLAEFDRRHVATISALWTPIELGTFSGFADTIFAGWQLGPIVRLATGSPLEFFTGEDRALDGVSDQHPMALANPAREHGSRHDQITEYFDTAAFAMPDIGTYGNAGKGLLSGPGSAIVDLAILKDLPLPLTPGARLQVRAEFFNLFNRPNFGNPDTGLSSARFGQITTAGAGREIQLGLKVLW